jgi:hypothetical protein
MSAPRRLSYRERELERINEVLRQRIAELEHPPHYIPIKCAEARGYSTETIRRWCHAGLVNCRRDGSRLLVDQDDLTARCNRLAG